MEFLKIVKPIVDYGFLTIFGALALYYLYKYINKQFDTRNRKKCNLQHHPILSEMDYLFTYIIPRVDFGTVGRTKLFIFMISSIVKTWRDEAMSILTCDFADTEDFINKNVKMFLTIVKRSEAEWITGKVPDVAIKAFNKWHNPRVAIIPKEIELIAKSDIYDSFIEKQWAVWDLYRFILNMTMLDAETTLKSLNGTLTGKVFQGEII